MKRTSSSHAFTIVELLVVIVVIAILAAITIAVYGGIQNRAATTVLISDLRNAATQLGKDNVLEGTYPATMTAADEGRGLQKSPGTTFQYTYTAASNSYCLTATSNRTGIPAYMISSETPTPREGICPGHTGPDAGGGSTGATYCTTALGQDVQDTRFTVDKDTNMIPVTYTGDGTTPEWQIADNTNWCNYNARQWANAVTVTPASLAAHKADPVGTTIPEADILGYWVYIPRYEYQVCRPLPSTTPAETAAASGCPSTTFEPYAFNINFQKSSQKTNYDGTTVGGWATHPAFTFGTAELNGIWVGKFEATGTAGAPTIKPNIASSNGQAISVQFASSQSIRSQHNLGSDKDTRMAKNSDWGAVAYLTTSTYGRWGSVGGNEVYINNNDYTTGCAGATANADVEASRTDVCDNVYNTTAGVHASTTDNIYGIYDMNGGTPEHVLANYNGEVGSAGAIPAAKYVNTYPASQFNGSYESNPNYNLCTWALCGGHALYEVTTVQSMPAYPLRKLWFDDNPSFVEASCPWDARGGYSYNRRDAGLFASECNMGDRDVMKYGGWRAVLSTF